MQRAAEPHADRAAQRGPRGPGDALRRGGRPAQPVHRRRRLRPEPRRVHAVVTARLPEPRSQHHRRGGVRRRRDGRHGRWRAVRHPRGSRRVDHDLERLRLRHAVVRRSRAPHRCRAATTARRVENRDGIRPGGEDGLARRRRTSSRASIPPPASPSTPRARSTFTPATTKAAAPPPRSSSAAPIRSSRASCPMRWRAIRRWRRWSPARSTPACAANRDGSPGTPDTSAPPTATTSCSCSPNRPASATSRTSAARGAKGSSSAHAARAGVAEIGAGYTLLDATFRSSEEVNGESNSTNDAAAAGGPGLEGSIEIEPGDRMPLIPRHMLKLYADIQVTRALGIDADLVAFSGSRRARERERRSRGGRHLLRRARRHGRVRRRQSGRALCSDVVAHTRWPGQQPVRPPLHDGGAARPDGVHARGCVRRAPVPAGWRRVPADAQHVLRAGRTGARLVRHAVPLLARAAVRCGCR